MNNLQNFALNYISRNSNNFNSPMGQQFIEILRSGNSAAGEQMVNNLCQSYGISKEQALQQARQFFGI